MFAKSILIVFLMAMSLAKTDDMMNIGSGTKKKSLKEVTIKEATKNPETYAVDTIKQAAVYLGTQFKRGIESNKKHMERDFITIQEKSQKTAEIMKKEYLNLAKKLKIFYQKSRELIEISEEISKDILKGDKTRTLYNKTKDSFRPLEQLNVIKLDKKIKSYVFRQNIKKNKE